jgi:hypothetical protein
LPLHVVYAPAYLQAALLAGASGYIVKKAADVEASETGVQKGTLDLDLQSDVSKGRLMAPGKLTISGLELAPAKSAFG